jgi:hypothetical protein
MSAQCFYQLGVLTYFQVNRDYIARILCVNKDEPELSCKGHCYLKRNLKLADEKQEALPESTEKSKTEIPVFLISEACFHSQPELLHCPSNFPPVKTSIAGYQTPIFHPPSSIA